MTYKKLKELTNGKQLPVAGVNEDGENVIIQHRTARERNYFRLTTAQHNGWTRVNIIYEDGSTEELYQK